MFKSKQKFYCDNKCGSTLTKRVVILLELLFSFKEIISNIIWQLFQFLGKSRKLVGQNWGLKPQSKHWTMFLTQEPVCVYAKLL